MNFKPWRPGDSYGVARFGLSARQWADICHLQHRYREHRDADDRYTPEPSPRMQLIRYLVATGRVNEGERHA